MADIAEESKEEAQNHPIEPIPSSSGTSSDAAGKGKNNNHGDTKMGEVDGGTVDKHSGEDDDGWVTVNKKTKKKKK
tara:strand:+ start:749 stop:976 length:228 start_codon:yes stop_codon:yes gene_type:complete